MAYLKVTKLPENETRWLNDASVLFARSDHNGRGTELFLTNGDKWIVREPPLQLGFK